MYKEYSFLFEGWFSKSDEEVARENIRNRTARECYEDLKTFLEYFRQVFFICDLLEGENYKFLITHITKYHSKAKDINSLTYGDLDLSGQLMFNIIGGIFEAYDNGVMKEILDKLRKHLDRFEPDEFKRFYLNTGLDSMYKDLYNYLKQNKLNAFITKIEKSVDSSPLIESLLENMKEVKSIANDRGYNIDSKMIPKMAIKSTIPKLNTKLNKSLFNTIPKNKIRHLKK